MSNPTVEAAFAALDPWITRFLIEDVPYGGWFDVGNDPRLTQFFESFPHAATILELGSLEGGHTIENRNLEATTSAAPWGDRQM
jgi:hypothetical protein